MTQTNTTCLPLLTEEQTAEYLGLRPETLATWRCTKRYSLPYVKVGRSIRYRPVDVENFVTERTVAARLNDDVVPAQKLTSFKYQRQIAEADERLDRAGITDKGGHNEDR
jgi:hypothetical protein